MRSARIAGVLCFAFSLVATVARSQAIADKPTIPPSTGIYQQNVLGTPPPEFGTVGVSFVRLAPPEFDPDTSGTTYSSTWFPPADYRYQRYVTGGFPHLFAMAHVPGGALFEEWDMAYCDDNASGPHMTFNLWNCDAGGNCNSTPVFSFQSDVFGTGCHNVAAFPGALQSITANNSAFSAQMLLVEVVFGATDGTNRIGGAGFGYKYQVSPAPGSATFPDVPTSDPAFQYIEALYASGITAGCAGGNYCPDAPLTRRQMAVFLSKGLGLSWNGY